MSELRWNPVLAEWVVTATHRQERTYHPPADFCPLCPTRPGGYPTEVPAEDYEIVVFENKFPSFSRTPPEPSVEGDDLYQVKPSKGCTPEPRADPGPGVRRRHQDREEKARWLRSVFVATYGEDVGCGEVMVVRAPGRVNLIGEHTVYNEGFVLPAAIDRDVMIAVRTRRDRVVRVRSAEPRGDCRVHP